MKFKKGDFVECRGAEIGSSIKYGHRYMVESTRLEPYGEFVTLVGDDGEWLVDRFKLIHRSEEEKKVATKKFKKLYRVIDSEDESVHTFDTLEEAKEYINHCDFVTNDWSIEEVSRCWWVTAKEVRKYEVEIKEL